MSCAGIGDNARDFAMGEHLALMQDHEVVAGWISSNRWVAHNNADALLADELTDVGKDVRARLDVESDGRLIEQQQPWALRAARAQSPAAASGRPRDRGLAAGAVGEAMRVSTSWLRKLAPAGDACKAA